MELKKLLIPCVAVILYSIAFGQEGSVNSKGVNEPFISEDRKLPEVIAYGLAWPSAEEMYNKTISAPPEAEQSVEAAISKCVKPAFYDANAVPKLISLGDWPRPYSVTRIKQFKKSEYTFHIYDDKRNLFIAVKRDDGKNIWDITKDHTIFVSQIIGTFFLNENIGPCPDKEMHYIPNKGGTEGFYYAYLPMDKRDFWSVYMWTDGKIVALRICKNFEEDKKKGYPPPRK
ncbi:MAG: hypothetical protein KAS69_06755 [Planctomycetes bacterium]|nr:hypothetical protein [Planctomycetota bacterium]